MVVTSAPSTNNARYRHPDTARPFTSTVQQPQSPWPQASRAPVRPNCACRSSIRLWCGSTIAAAAAPLSVKWMTRCGLISRLVERSPGPGAQRPIDRFGIERQLGEANADRVIDRVGDRRRHAEGRDLTDALGAEWAVVLKIVDREILHCSGEVADAGDLVIRQRSVGDLPAVEVHLLEHREAEVHQGRARDLRLHELRIDWRTAVNDVDELGNHHVPGFDIDLDLGTHA